VQFDGQADAAPAFSDGVARPLAGPVPVPVSLALRASHWHWQWHISRRRLRLVDSEQASSHKWNHSSSSRGSRLKSDVAFYSVTLRLVVAA
jgi:hypothetical protein